MKIPSPEARDIIQNDHSEWKEIEVNLEDNGRWSIHFKGVFQHIPTDRFYSISWSEAATEQQDEKPFEYTDEVEFKEVFPIQKTITVYE